MMGEENRIDEAELAARYRLLLKTIVPTEQPRVDEHPTTATVDDQRSMTHVSDGERQVSSSARRKYRGRFIVADESADTLNRPEHSPNSGMAQIGAADAFGRVRSQCIHDPRDRGQRLQRHDESPGLGRPRSVIE